MRWRSMVVRARLVYHGIELSDGGAHRGYRRPRLWLSVLSPPVFYSLGRDYPEHVCALPKWVDCNAIPSPWRPFASIGRDSPRRQEAAIFATSVIVAREICILMSRGFLRRFPMYVYVYYCREASATSFGINSGNYKRVYPRPTKNLYR